MKILRWKVSRNKYSMNHNVCSTTSKCFFSTLINAKLMQNIGLTDNPFWVLLGFIIHVAFLKMLLEKDKTNQTNKKAPAQERHLFKNTYNLTWKYYQFYILHWAILIFYISCVKTCCLKTPLFAYMLRFSRNFITLISLFLFFPDYIPTEAFQFHLWNDQVTVQFTWFTFLFIYF